MSNILPVAQKNYFIYSIISCIFSARKQLIDDFSHPVSFVRFCLAWSEEPNN